MPLSSRERVLAVLNQQKPDRVPIIIGASNATGIKIKPYQGIKNILGITSEDHYIYDWPELGTALPDEDILIRLKSDVRGVWDSHPAHILERKNNRPPGSPFIDSWGSGQIQLASGEWFPGIHPMADAKTIEEIENYSWPDMDDPSRVAHVKQAAQKLAQENNYAIMGTPWLLFPFERAFAMQGMDKFLLNMGKNPDFAVHLLEKIASLCKSLMGHFLHECGEYLDIIKIGDDLGTQERLMISPKMYRKMLKPIHADFISFIKERTKAKVFFHTDGDVFDLLDDFVEIGIDILNPIQTSSGRMANISEIKDRYGKNLVFCGGIDTHHILPKGSPEDVRKEVKCVIQELGKDGGFIVAAVHTIMNDVPAENVLAMVDAVEEFGRYQ